MKKLIAIGLAVAMVLTLAGTALASVDKTGNGAPSGPHYNLNIIGVPKQMNDNFTGGNGSRIFVSRTGSTQFFVHGGKSYAILDHDGTDGQVGSGLDDPGIVFPYDSGTGTWLVQIYVRLLGPQNSKVNWTSYFYDWDPTSGTYQTYVLWDSFELSKDTKFSEKTGSLLRDGYQDMMWQLDPVTKFRICQMRIYATPKS